MSRAQAMVLAAALVACNETSKPSASPTASARHPSSCAVDVRIEESRGTTATVSQVRTGSCIGPVNVLIPRSPDNDKHAAYYLELAHDGAGVRYDITQLDAADDLRFVLTEKMRVPPPPGDDGAVSVADDALAQAKLGYRSQGQAVLDDGNWIEVARGTWDDGQGYRISLRAPL